MYKRCGVRVVLVEFGGCMLCNEVDTFKAVVM